MCGVWGEGDRRCKVGCHIAPRSKHVGGDIHSFIRAPFKGRQGRATVVLPVGAREQAQPLLERVQVEVVMARRGVGGVVFDPRRGWGGQTARG